MNWINEFIKASFSLYSGNTISAFQPLDFFHFYGIWYDLWLKNIDKVLDKIEAENKSYNDLRRMLPTPSNLRALIQKAITAYIGSNRSNPKIYARYSNFVARMLVEACPKDPFGFTSTPLHNQSEILNIIKNTAWQKATPDEAKIIGKIITAAGSLAHGLYNDVVTDYGWDTYGPYENQKKGEGKYTLLIRNFPDLRPKGLWLDKLYPAAGSIQIYQLYQEVDWNIGFVGCHTIIKSGDPIKGLKYYSIIINERPLKIKEVTSLINELAVKAEFLYSEIRKKDFEQLKQMVMLQECYQLKKLFDYAGVDWRPTPEMTEKIKNKPLLKGILPYGVMMTNLNEYKRIFHFKEFEDEVLIL